MKPEERACQVVNKLVAEGFHSLQPGDLGPWVMIIREAISAAVAQERNAALVWLGYWRDRIPREAVFHLQDVLSVAAAIEAKDG